MLTHASRSVAQRALPMCLASGRSTLAKRSIWGRHSLVPWTTTPPTFRSPRGVFADLERQLGDLEKAFWDSPLSRYGWRPFIEYEHPTTTELYRLKNPIVEEDGVKKFKLEFDVRRFSAENVKISTNAKDGTLTVEAKQEDESSRFQYLRTISIPEGVKLSEITCKHRSDGVLTLEAPYEEPESEPLKETPIEIEHK